MNISLKSIKIIYWLVTLNLILSLMLASQLKLESSSWRLDAVQIMFYIVLLGLYLYVTKLFGKAIFTAASNSTPRFNSKIKTQLWGLLVRSFSGFIGFVIFSLLLPLPVGGIMFVSAFYAMVVLAGFYFDGKRYDEQHI